MKQKDCKKVCGYCDKPLSKDKICKEINCMYNGMKQLNPQVD